MERPNNENHDRGVPNSFKAMRESAPLLGAGIQMAAAIILMFFFGQWLDSKLGTSPWLMLVGIFLGAGGGLYSFIQTVNKVERDNS